MTQVLETELRTHEAMRAELPAAGRCRFVLIHGANVHGLFGFSPWLRPTAHGHPPRPALLP